MQWTESIVLRTLFPSNERVTIDLQSIKGFEQTRRDRIADLFRWSGRFPSSRYSLLLLLLLENQLFQVNRLNLSGSNVSQHIPFRQDIETFETFHRRFKVRARPIAIRAIEAIHTALFRVIEDSARWTEKDVISTADTHVIDIAPVDIGQHILLIGRRTIETCSSRGNGNKA